MSTLQDQLAAQTVVLNQILSAVQALSPAKAEDLTPVTSAVATVQLGVNSIQTAVSAIAAKLPVDQVGQQTS